jgi:hypothetical protein
MVIKEVKYSKEYLSETGYEPSGSHGQPPERDYQKINSKEENLRKEVVKNLDFSYLFLNDFHIFFPKRN